MLAADIQAGVQKNGMEKQTCISFEKGLVNVKSELDHQNNNVPIHFCGNLLL